MNDRQRQFDLMFGFRWLVTCAVGLLVAMGFAFAIVWSSFDAVQNETVAYALAGAILGGLTALGASLGPGLLLQARGVDFTRWIGASVLAGALGVAVTMTVLSVVTDVESLTEAAAGVAIGSSLGLPLGIAQWLIFRRYGLRVNIWPIITLAAFLAGMVGAMSLGGEGREWLSLVGAGLLVGSITALGIVWSLRQETQLAF